MFQVKLILQIITTLLRTTSATISRRHHSNLSWKCLKVSQGRQDPFTKEVHLMGTSNYLSLSRLPCRDICILSHQTKQLALLEQFKMTSILLVSIRMMNHQASLYSNNILVDKEVIKGEWAMTITRNKRNSNYSSNNSKILIWNNKKIIAIIIDSRISLTIIITIIFSLKMCL